MRILKPFVLVCTAGFFAAATLALSAYKEGPFPNMAGGFGDESCHKCHFDNPLNEPGGTLTIAGVPPTYSAGRAYPVTVTLSRAGMRRGGFEVVARFGSGRLKGK